MFLWTQLAFQVVPAHSKGGQSRVLDRGCSNAVVAPSWLRGLKPGVPLAGPLLPQTRAAPERRTTWHPDPPGSRCNTCFHGVPGSYRLYRGYMMIRVP